jgi:hypothetical protein
MHEIIKRSGVEGNVWIIMNSQTPRGSDSKSADEAEICTLYQQMMEGWNKGSGNDFAAPFTDDSDFFGFDGTYLKGCQQIVSFQQELFEKFIKGSHLVGKISNTAQLFLKHCYYFVKIIK